ncbi:MAG: hypothetical protein MJZ34_05345 [Paludibacteraceae bacterium]|nr:hypothetical protein [Paludibacteraceae bacterium]
MKKWSENEVKNAIEKEFKYYDENKDGYLMEYVKSCYDSALKAYHSLCDDGHSGGSYDMSKGILIRLLEGLPLTEINDNENEWVRTPLLCTNDYDGYSHSRMYGFYKYVYKDSSVKYVDVNRVICTNQKGVNQFSGTLCNIIEDMFPITMPYFPSVYKYIGNVYEFEYDNSNYQALLSVSTPERKVVEINMFFKDEKAISMEEFENSMKMAGVDY